MRKLTFLISLLVGMGLIATLAYPPLAQAQMTSVQMGVDGMIWPIWAYGAQKALSRLDGVDKVKVSLQEAAADIQLKERQPLEIEKLRKAVVDAGFTPSWIRFEAVGQLTTRDGGPAFKVKGTDQIILLVGGEKLEELRKSAGQDGKLISILGLIPKGKEAAQIERFEVR